VVPAVVVGRRRPGSDRPPKLPGLAARASAPHACSASCAGGRGVVL